MPRVSNTRSRGKSTRYRTCQSKGKRDDHDDIDIDESDKVRTFFDLGSATADWDTFTDPLDPNPITTIPGDFVVDGDQIQAHARDTSLFGSGQQVADIAKCATKTSSQFGQQTKPPKICDIPGHEDNLAEGKCVLP